MAVVGPPAEPTDLEAFRAELEQIISGAPVALDTPPPRRADVAAEPEPEPEAEPPDGQVSARRSGVASYQPTILDLPPCERPRERLREHGPRYLNNAELVAILLRSGVAGENAISLAMRILAEFEGLAGLARVGYAELCEQRGLNHAKSSEIMAALELGRRIASLAPEERAQISCPQDAASLLAAEMEPLVQENLVVLLLNTPEPGCGSSHDLYRDGEQQRGAPRRGSCDPPSGRMLRQSSWPTTTRPAIRRPVRRMFR